MNNCLRYTIAVTIIGLIFKKPCCRRREWGRYVFCCIGFSLVGDTLQPPCRSGSNQPRYHAEISFDLTFYWGKTILETQGCKRRLPGLSSESNHCSECVCEWYAHPTCQQWNNSVLKATDWLGLAERLECLLPFLPQFLLASSQRIFGQIADERVHTCAILHPILSLLAAPGNTCCLLHPHHYLRRKIWWVIYCTVGCLLLASRMRRISDDGTALSAGEPGGWGDFWLRVFLSPESLLSSTHSHSVRHTYRSGMGCSPASSAREKPV